MFLGIIIVSVLVGAILADQLLTRLKTKKDVMATIFESNKYPFISTFTGTVTISGIWDCLPKDFIPSEGNECVLGVKESEGRYFLILTVNQGPGESGSRDAGENVTLIGIPRSTIKTKDGSLVNFFEVDFLKQP